MSHPKGPREWPNAAKEARDRAAEETNEALYIARALEDCATSGSPIKVMQLRVHLTNALRWLERVGAQTRPE